MLLIKVFIYDTLDIILINLLKYSVLCAIGQCLKGVNRLIMNADISIVVPVYNSEETLGELIESILRQSFNGSIECLFIDDGSIDNSIKKIEEYHSDFEQRGIVYRIYKDGQNKKQGARRNQGIDMAHGDYILFIDSDDYIHSKTLEVTYNSAKEDDDIDMVYFNYAFYFQNKEKKQRVLPKVYNYLYNSGSLLVGEDCEKLFDYDPLFTVNKLYKRSFLIENSIKFGEGYFYEDIEFYVEAAQYAKKVKLLPNIFYYVRSHESSTTKTDTDSTVHMDSYIMALENTLSRFNPRQESSYYNLTKYLVNRTLLYVQTRTVSEKKVRRQYLQQAFDLLYTNLDKIEYPNSYVSSLYYAIFGMGYFQNKDVEKMMKIYNVYLNAPKKLYAAVHSHKLKPTRKLNKLHKFLLRPSLIIELTDWKIRLFGSEKKQVEEKTEDVEEQAELSPTILMLGFDYRYVGNSKYLFDYLSKQYPSDVLKFVSEDERVPEEYRIEPRSDEFFECLNTASVIIAESWIPLTFNLSDNQKLIQLWHGTPFKKLLFDSPEIEVVRSNPRHKIQKKLDINRWDVLISDSPIATDKFLTSFSIERNLIKEVGYPRNKWLVDNKDNTKLKEETKKELGISKDKTVITYLPTWRDYNFRSRNLNEGYLLNFRRFISHLPKDFDFVILTKLHDLSEAEQASMDKNLIIDVPKEEDIQKYLLISDVVISDYSSVIFDCLYIDVPVYLLFKDFDYYQTVRGIYDDIAIRFEKSIAFSEKELAEKIVQYQSFYETFDKKGLICDKIEQNNDYFLNLIAESLKK